MAINLHQINEHEKKKAAQQAEAKPDMTQPMTQPSSGLAQGVDKSPINNPALDESLKQSVADNVMSKPMASVGTSLSSMATAPTQGTLDSPGHNFNETADMIGKRNRINYVRGFNTWADAEKAGDVSQQEWITQKINQMVERGENPGEYETLMSLMGSAETPDEIKKRERRNALGETFRNLGNLIGNAANLYYTNKGGQYIDLNTANEKHRERMQRLKDKQDALAEKRNNILINAKLGDLKAARAEATRLESEKKQDAIRKENQERDDKRTEQAQKNWETQFNWNVQKAEEEAKRVAEDREYKRKQDEHRNQLDKDNLALRWAELNYRKERDSKEGKSGKKDEKIVVDTINGAMNVDFDKMNETTIGQMYQKLSDDIKKKYDVSGVENKNERLQLMNEAIGEGLRVQKGYSDWLETTGIGEYQKKPNASATIDYVPTSTPVDNKPVEVVNYTPTENFTVETIKKRLKDNKEKKTKILQQGRDSVDKVQYGMKSDTFRQ